MPKATNTAITGGLDDKPGQVDRTSNPLTTDVEFNRLPPKTMLAAPKKIWKEFLSNYPDKAFSDTDRFQLEVLCNLMHEYRTDPQVLSSQKLSQLIRLLDNMGGSLKAKSSLNTQAPAEDDSSAEYLKIFSEKPE